MTTTKNKPVDPRLAEAKSEVERRFEEMEAAMRKEYAMAHNVERKGDRISIPLHMELKDAINAMTAMIREQDEEASIRIQIECNSNDGLVCFSRAMTRVFGSLLASENYSFFGIEPAQNVSIPVDFGVTESVPLFNVRVPGLPISMSINKKGNGTSMREVVTVDITYQRLYETMVKKVEREFRQELATNSIFKGKAFKSDFTFIDLSTDTSRLVHSRKEERVLESNLFLPITNPKLCKELGIPNRRSILLEGPFGTGKTLTAIKAAQLAIKNGYTVIFAAADCDIATALTIAKRYAPALLSFEDVDSQTSGSRDTRLNRILEESDGALTKSDHVLSILTTNNIDVINPAMLRPGRIDLIVRLGKLDPETTLRMVAAYADNRLDESVTEDALWKAAKEFSPAFIAEVVHKASLYATIRVGKTLPDGKRPVLSIDDLASAFTEMEPQLSMVKRDHVVPTPPLDSSMNEIIEKAVYNKVVGPLLAEGVLTTTAIQDYEKSLNNN